MDDEIVDFSAKEIVTIGILDGDGIGSIIMPHAVKALETLLAEEIASGSIVLKRIEGLTIENRMTLGQSVPDDVLAEIKTCDVLLKGPTTTPVGGKMESANVTLRRALDLYANCRPVSIPEQNIDWMFFRENTEGEYVLGSRLFEQGLSAYANPASILRATAMLLRHICRSNAAQRLEQALNSCNLKVGVGAFTGAQYAGAVIAAL